MSQRSFIKPLISPDFFQLSANKPPEHERLFDIGTPRLRTDWNIQAAIFEAAMTFSNFAFEEEVSQLEATLKIGGVPVAINIIQARLKAATINAKEEVVPEKKVIPRRQYILEPFSLLDVTRGQQVTFLLRFTNEKGKFGFLSKSNGVLFETGASLQMNVEQTFPAQNVHVPIHT